jgi:hypothetical protein
MEKQSRVKSQITDKVYEVSLDDLDEEDEAFESQLYRVNVFGKNLLIAPGKPIKDTRIQGLVYFYVYVIKNEKVVAKLGVYEITTSKTEEIYDLTTFPDGGLLMFDVYYNKPLLITEFEEIESTNTTVKGVNIFDYLAKERLVTEANTVSKIKEQNKRITSLKISCTTYYTKIGKPEIGTEYKELLNMFKDKIIDKQLLTLLKSINPNNFMFILHILQILLNVRFIYIDTDNTIISDDDYKQAIKIPTSLTDTIVVRLGQVPTFVKLYTSDTPREIIEQEIAELAPQDPEEAEREELEGEEELEEEISESKIMNPLNRIQPARGRLGTSLNTKPLQKLEPLQPIEYSPHTPEGIGPEEFSTLNAPKVSAPKVSAVPFTQPTYSPQTPEGIGPEGFSTLKEPNVKAPNVKAPNVKAPNVKAPNVKLNNESPNESVDLNELTPVNLNNSGSNNSGSNVESINSNTTSTSSTKLSMLGGKLKVKKSK